MSIQRRYRFTVTWDSNANVLDPDYSGAVTEARPEEYVFYRRSFGGKLVFYRSQYDSIVAADFETTYNVLVEVQLPSGYYETVFEGYFTKTDLTIDEEDRVVEVQPITLDAYTPILDNREKEIDLVEEDCPITAVGVKRNPAVQIYLRGTTGSEAAHQEIMTIVGDNAFMSQVTDPLVTSQQLQNDYHFAEIDTLGYIPPVAGLSPDVSGYYEIATLPTGGLGFRRLDGAYWLTNSLAYYPGSSGGTPPPSGGIGITDNATGNYVYETEAGVTLFPSDATFNEQSPEYTSLTDPDSKCRFYYIQPFARVLCNAATFNGNPTQDVPDNDIIEDQLNYRKVAPYPTASITLKSQTRAAESSLGKVPSWAYLGSGQYHFQQLFGAVTEIPLFPELWTAVSVWWTRDIAATLALQTVEEDIEIKHAFKLSDAVLTLANALGSSVTSVQSDFFYGTNPIRSGFEPFIVPKSNVAVANYNAPASKAPIKWQDIDTLLRFYNAAWIIEGDVLRIEHISYFDNGKDYNTPQIGIDLTTDCAPKAGEMWTYGQSVYSYNKPEIPAEIIMEWPEDVSPFFEGYPIECISAYVTSGQIENIPLTPFISDLEGVMLREASLEGFVLIEAELISGSYRVAFYQYDNLGWQGDIQNGYASLFYAADAYHKHAAPCSKLVINKVETTATTVKRNKIQEIEYPNKTIYPDKLVKTALGDGKIITREINLITGHNKIQLEHDTE